jgi:hypothetical protein
LAVISMKKSTNPRAVASRGCDLRGLSAPTEQAPDALPDCRTPEPEDLGVRVGGPHLITIELFWIHRLGLDQLRLPELECLVGQRQVPYAERLRGP